jgi:hypothetical protein
VSAFISATQDENEAMFDQSDIAALSCIEKNRHAWGMSDDGILEHLGKQTGRSRTVLYGRLLVGRVFPPGKRNLALSWSHHEVCARTWSEATPDVPQQWLEYAADNDLSVRELKIEIQGGARVRPFYLLNAANATLVSVDHTRMVIEFDEDKPVCLPDDLDVPATVIVTAALEPVRVPLPPG